MPIPSSTRKCPDPVLISVAARSGNSALVTLNWRHHDDLSRVLCRAVLAQQCVESRPRSRSSWIITSFVTLRTGTGVFALTIVILAMYSVRSVPLAIAIPACDT